MKLRPYQSDLFQQVINLQDNLLVQLDTGAGKTPIIAKLAEHYEHVAIVCHRNILIKQASEKLAMCGVEHAIMASNQTKKISAGNNFDKTGAHFINPKSTVILISIDTFNSRLKAGKKTLDNSQNWIVLLDEAHHFAEENKWETIQQYLNCRVVGFTATPLRGDGQPMLKKFDGFFDDIIQAKGYENNATETLISQGYLSEYAAYYCQPMEVDTFDDDDYAYEIVESQSSGADMQLQKVLNLGTCVYERVLNYDEDKQKRDVLSKTALDTVLDKCQGKQTLVVFPRIEIAKSFIEQARQVNHSAQTIHSELPQYEIQRILAAYERGDIKTLASVDMINEGFDLPAVDALILCRDVRSFGFYRQICGRVLRPKPGKKAVIYDLTGACIPRHGLPSDPVDWHQAQIGQVRKDLKICPFCNAYIKRKYEVCPHCNALLPDDRKAKKGSEMTVSEYLSELREVHRQQVAEIERKRLKAEQKAQAEKTYNETYIDHNCYFATTFVGKRCQYFFDALKKELKYLPYANYNDFFIKNKDNFNDLSFYIGIFTADFDDNKKTQCRALYEKYK